MPIDCLLKRRKLGSNVGEVERGGRCFGSRHSEHVIFSWRELVAFLEGERL
jgi:hypothetical protein